MYNSIKYYLRFLNFFYYYYIHSIQDISIFLGTLSLYLLNCNKRKIINSQYFLKFLKNYF